MKKFDKIIYITCFYQPTFYILFCLFFMVQCEFCLNYNGITCIEPKSERYGKKFDPWEEIDCPYYLEKGIAGLLGFGLDNL